MYKNSQKKIDRMPSQKRGTKNPQKEGNQFLKEGQKNKKKWKTIPKKRDNNSSKRDKKNKKRWTKIPKKRGPKTMVERHAKLHPFPYLPKLKALLGPPTAFVLGTFTGGDDLHLGIGLMSSRENEEVPLSVLFVGL